MSNIPFTRYIDIVSGVGGNGTVKERDLITRVMTTNPLLPPQSFIEFEDENDVGSYFGTVSEEYNRALDYFSFVSKTAGSPDKISFARWVNAASKAMAYGDPTATATLGALQLITAGKLTVTIGGVLATLTGLNFSGAATLAAVATIVQTALVAVAGLAGSTVTYNAVAGNFQINGPTVGAGGGTIVFATDGAETASLALGFLSANTIISPASNVETITQTLNNTVSASNNFATFGFTTGSALSQAQYLEAATWNAANNVEYGFQVPVTATNAAAMYTALGGQEGTIFTVSPLTAEYPEMIPGKILASTDYTKPNSVKNYMYQSDPSCTPSVTDGPTADAMDAIRVNYVGRTQQNGQLLAFYQTGVMLGGQTAPSDIGVFFNEIWFKNDIAGGFMSAFLSLEQIPTDARGVAICLAIIQASIDKAIINGTIQTNKAVLTPAQVQFITSTSNDPKASQQVNTIGYWLNINFAPVANANGTTTWVCNYLLIYAKGDSIRQVKGTHSLI